MKTHHGYKLTLRQLDKCEETRYEVTKTSTARFLLGETMSRQEAITLCDKHNVTIRNSSGLYMGGSNESI
mgnify:FL=1